jgi:hypothetical protein
MKTLVDTLGWVPVLGTILKTTYIANCAKDAIMKVDVDEKSIKSDNASQYIKDLADEAYDEFLKPELVLLQETSDIALDIGSPFE